MNLRESPDDLPVFTSHGRGSDGSTCLLRSSLGVDISCILLSVCCSRQNHICHCCTNVTMWTYSNIASDIHQAVSQYSIKMGTKQITSCIHGCRSKLPGRNFLRCNAMNSDHKNANSTHKIWNTIIIPSAKPVWAVLYSIPYKTTFLYVCTSRYYSSNMLMTTTTNSLCHQATLPTVLHVYHYSVHNMPVRYWHRHSLSIRALNIDSNKNKKFELMLTRRAKAYSSSCSQTVSLSPAISSQSILGVCTAAEDCKNQ